MAQQQNKNKATSHTWDLRMRERGREKRSIIELLPHLKGSCQSLNLIRVCMRTHTHTCLHIYGAVSKIGADAVHVEGA